MKASYGKKKLNLYYARLGEVKGIIYIYIYKLSHTPTFIRTGGIESTLLNRPVYGTISSFTGIIFDGVI